jgi:hypothetical protein
VSNSVPNTVAPKDPPSVLPLIMGFMASRVVCVAAELGLADLLAEGAQTSETLAARTRTHAPSLHRLLQALTSLGVLDEIEPRHFRLTALGARLRSGVSDSQRNIAMMFSGERAWRSWGDLLYSVQTGESAATHLYGMNGFEYFARHPEQAAIFNAAMAEHTHHVGQALAAALDFSRFRTIVDVGGGNGALLAIILTACPDVHGVVFDLPRGCEDAQRHVEAAGVADRCEVIPGDFFQAVPTGADAYVLKNVIHDWDDGPSVSVLKRCREAMLEKSKLLLVERLMPVKMEVSIGHSQIAMMDMNMLVMPGGRERTELEYTNLLEAAGLRWSATIRLPVASGHSAIVGAPN